MVLLQLNETLSSTAESTRGLEPGLGNLVLVGSLLEELRSVLKLGGLVKERELGQSSLGLLVNVISCKYLFHEFVSLLSGHDKLVFAKMPKMGRLSRFVEFHDFANCVPVLISRDISIIWSESKVNPAFHITINIKALIKLSKPHIQC